MPYLYYKSLGTYFINLSWKNIIHINILYIKIIYLYILKKKAGLMKNIGILQNRENIDIYKIVNSYIKNKDNKLKINVELITNKIENNKYNIFILDKDISNFIINKSFCENAIILLNIDEKFNLPIKFSTPVKIITYGFNPKACVTASSVINGDYNTIQLCIQRTLLNLQGKPLYPQEFSVFSQCKNPLNVISAVTSLILIGYDIKELNRNLFV